MSEVVLTGVARIRKRHDTGTVRDGCSCDPCGSAAPEASKGAWKGQAKPAKRSEAKRSLERPAALALEDPRLPGPHLQGAKDLPREAHCRC